jgi:branched-chain amino acid transport system permease protein
MEFLGQVFLNGLFTSCLYALLALGTTLLFGVLRIGDLAQGALYAVAGYLVFFATKFWGLDFFLAAGLALLLVILLSILNGHFIYRRLQKLGIGQTFLGAVGLLIIIQNTLVLGFTWEPQALHAPWENILLALLGTNLPIQKILLMGLALFGLIGLWYFLEKTYYGKALRALAQNREAAQCVGVNVTAMTALAFGISGLITGSTGVLMATLWPLTPYGGTLLVLKAFAITIIGMGHVPRLLFTAMAVGFGEVLVQAYWQAAFSDLVPFVLLALLLLWKPHALGPEEDERVQQRAPAAISVNSKWDNKFRFLLPILILLAALIPLLAPGNFGLHLLILIGINIILVSGLDLLTGYTGIPSLAQAGLFGVGAYASALVALKLGGAFPFTLVTAILTAMGVALLMGYLGLRLQGRWTSFTFIVGIVITLLISALAFLTGGTQGLLAIPPLKIDLPMIGSIVFNPYRDKLAYFYLTLGFVALTLWLKHRLVHSKMGKALVAIREDEVLAQSIGVHITRNKLSAFLVSALFCGIAGSLYAHYLAYLNPDLFTFQHSFYLYVMNLVGGAGTLFGSILGPTALTLFAEFTRPINGSIAAIAFGVALLVSLIYLPRGLAGAFEKMRVLRSDKKARPNAPLAQQALEPEEVRL